MKSLFKALLGGLVIVVTLVAIGGALGSYYVYDKFNKPGILEQKTLFTVPKGAHLGSVAWSLQEKGIIDGAIIFRIMAKITDRAEKIKAGEYELDKQMSMKEILDKLVSGKVYARQVTIREGLTNFEIERLLSDQDDLKKGAVTKQYPEGHLLPETYSYSLDESNADIMSRMNAALEETLDEAWKNRVDDLPIKTKEEALILASIIEKETAVGAERKRVAGVFINRLRKGIMLQSDPTVIYALTMGEHKNDGKGPLGRRLLKKDLEIDSPYNTYKYAGLPPTPIANPGKASIDAALNPEEHKYLYFVADGSGGHAFAETLREHNNNVAKWRKIRRKK